MANTDDAENWRELADQLSPEQVAELERLEGSPDASSPAFLVPERRLGGRAFGGDERRHLLDVRLRSMAQRWVHEKELADKVNALNRRCPAPPDATRIDPWNQHYERNGLWYRQFDGKQWEIRDAGVFIASVTISGRQFEDGRCERDINSRTDRRDRFNCFGEAAAAQAREVVTAPREAADHVESLSRGAAPIRPSAAGPPS
ncbi:hypothetical protein [Mycobacterium ostraviense]|uniref:Uncharacterized protein n=1 Tax=Mycobacterium ostraviense TaxID=2738409 RepID=A0A164EIA5_9MYCO|nr:hypothetical protein [Mycobacterium ostraviense]KZS67563.1 hypothetical protein A4G28_13745 [Mycobacterium ostraviense]UGT91403.1 hypothetical protein LTS72_25105 [Mycobacterium ostraviense]